MGKRAGRNYTSYLAHPGSDALAYCHGPSDRGATGDIEAVHPPLYFRKAETLPRSFKLIACPCVVDHRFDESHVGIVIEIDGEEAARRTARHGENLQLPLMYREWLGLAVVTGNDSEWKTIRVCDLMVGELGYVTPLALILRARQRGDAK